jgi:sporulation integral membrane protein YtvI
VIISVLAGVYLSFRLALFFLPFVIAFILSSFAEPLIRLLTRKFHLKRKLAAPIILLFFLLIVVFILVLIVLKLISEAKSFIAAIPGFFTSVYTYLNIWISNITVPDWLPPEMLDSLGSVADNISNIITNLSVTVTNLGKSILKGAYTTAISFPEILLFTIITIMATFFMASDREKISSVFLQHLPRKWVARILTLKNDMFSAIFGYLRAAMIIMLITFTELFIGLTIIGVKYSLLLALIIALVDALPVLGAGGALIPWSIITFLVGNTKLGISIFVLYLIILVVRQIIEPRIVGQQIGVHPLLTLMAMYAGLQLIGVGGLILGPIAFILIRNIIITIYKGKTFKDIIGLSDKSSRNEPRSTKPPSVDMQTSVDGSPSVDEPASANKPVSADGLASDGPTSDGSA